jgi:hypothetical protein
VAAARDAGAGHRLRGAGGRGHAARRRPPLRPLRGALHPAPRSAPVARAAAAGGGRPPRGEARPRPLRPRGSDRALLWAGHPLPGLRGGGAHLPGLRDGAAEGGARGLAALPHRRLGPRPGHPARAAPRPHPRSHQRLAAQLAAAQLDALRADLDPHFLFNALNAIASQCASDPVAAEDNIVRLSTLLRAVLDTRQLALHPLDDELALARDYTGLLQARYPSMRVSIERDDDLAAVDVPRWCCSRCWRTPCATRVSDGTIVVTARARGRRPGAHGAQPRRLRGPGRAAWASTS